MTPTAIVFMLLFAVIIWGGLVAAVVNLRLTDDDVTGELGTSPGTDDESLSRVHPPVVVENAPLTQ